jgi:hypothetical protein
MTDEPSTPGVVLHRSTTAPVAGVSVAGVSVAFDDAVDGAAFEAWLAALLANASDVQMLRARLATPWQQALLWRCSIAARVDRPLLEGVLGEALPDAPSTETMWQWLAEHPDVDPAPGTSDALMVRDTAREGLFAPGAVVDKRRAGAARMVAAALVPLYRRRGSAWRQDWLAALCIAEPHRARRTARRDLQSALRRGDYTAALQLLRVLEGRAPQLQALATQATDAAALHEAIAELRREYDAARLFSTDFERSAHALERDVMEDAWRWARGGGKHSQWLLNLEAKGGSGKTMFLRWVAARRCLPHGVPYARLDFDFIDVRLTAAAPWYLLAQIARTLDPQLPGRPFRELVRRADELVDPGRFALGPADVAQALEQLRSPTAAILGAEIVTEFTQLLRNAAPPSVVVVLDTLEVVLTDPGTDLMALLTMLETVHREVPTLRVILSGRFDLAQRLPSFTSRFGAAVRPCALTRLDDDEALQFLTRIRGLPEGPVARAIVTRSRGLPFALSLFADEWLINPRLTVREVRQVPGPELHYLVERVLRRIPAPIAWLLRYSVVARRLTRALLVDVIVPELEAMRQSGSVESPLRNADVVARYFDEQRDAIGEAVLSADRLWEDLERHASTFSFVSRDETAAGSLKLHEEVLRPLSRALRTHRVLKRLHRAAMRKAIARAGALTVENEAAWVAEQRDALYHALRLSITEGRRLWARLLTRVTNAAVHTARRQLAEELLDESLALPRALREHAARERAEASLALAEQYDRSAAHEWSEAERAVALWRELVPRARRAHDGRLVVAEVRLQARAGTAGPAAVRRLERLLHRRRAPAERLTVLLTLQRACTGTPSRRRYAEAAYALLARPVAGVPPVTRLRSLLQVADEVLRHGDYARALAIVTKVVRSRRLLTPTEQLQLLAQQAWLLSTIGDYARLARLGARVPALDAEFSAQLHSGAPADESVVVARAVLRRELSRGAIEGGPPAPPPFEADRVPPLARSYDATTDADVAFAAADAGRTLECIGRARELLPQGSAEEAVTLFLGIAAVMRDLVGDTRQARSALLAAQSVIVADGSDAWWNLQLVRCIQENGEHEALAAMRARAKRAPAVSAGIAIALSRLAMAARLDGEARERATRSATDALLAALVRITPVQARRRHLFRSLPDPRLVPTDARRRDRLMEILGLARPPRRAASDAEWVERLALRRFAHANDAEHGVSEPRTLRTVAGVARAASMAGDDPPTAICDDEALTRGNAAPFAIGIARHMRAKVWADEGRVVQARHEATAARELLTRDDVPPSIWLARTNLVLARLLGASDVARREFLSSAEEITERLGSAIGGTEVERAYEALQTAIASFALDSSVVSVNVDRATFDVYQPLAAALANDDAARGGALTPVATIGHLAKQLLPTLDAMRKALPTTVAPAVARLVIVGTSRARAALPWELLPATSRGPALRAGWRNDEDSRHVANERWLKRALMTAMSKPSAQSLPLMLRQFQQLHALALSDALDADTLRVLVATLRGGRPPRVVLALAGREYGPAAMIEKRYYGLPVERVTPPRIAAAVLREIADRAPDVLHIVAPVVESRSFGGLAFDLGEGAAGRVASGARYLPVVEITNVLKRPDSVLRPLMIVHNTLDRLPLPELWRQYALRNIAAMELARSGSPVATVALSSGWFIDGANALAPLLKVIASGRPLLTLIEEQSAKIDRSLLRQLPLGLTVPSRLVSALTRHGTVVFANNPAWVAV